MLVLTEDSQLYGALRRLATDQRMVFFAGLPGMGKSLLIHQLAHLAGAAGRKIHLLQWDVARPVFEACEAGQRYPMVGGVTHGVIRKAIGLWSRHAVLDWHRDHPAPEHLLIGEIPLVGHRLIELARPVADAAESLLTAGSCCFVIPVPSREVRRFLEAERARRAERPAHEREREDAPPDVLRELWQQLVGVAGALGVVGATRAPDASVPYDPLVYRQVYQLVLKHRRTRVVTVDTVLSTGGVSAYDFAIARRDVAPSPDDAARFIREVEAQYPDSEPLEREIDRWYVV